MIPRYLIHWVNSIPDKSPQCALASDVSAFEDGSVLIQIAEHVAHCIKESLIEETKDRCVICGCITEYDRFDHIDKRYYYVEGAGQVCPDCY